MIFMGPSSWSHGAEIGGVYLIRDQDDLERMGHNNRQPKIGDICLCIEHSGDCFYDYIVLRRKKGHRMYRSIFVIGAYVFGKKIGKLSETNLCLARAKRPVRIPFAGK